MPVIIRDKRMIKGKEMIVKIYKTDKILTKEEKEKANKLDVYIKNKMSMINKKMKNNKLINLKNKPGVIDLWYAVGKELNFVDDTNLVPLEDKKDVWTAIFYHANDLKPGELSVRVKERPLTSHFHYCYLIGKYPEKFVKNAGNWTAWYEFLDSEKIREDDRFIKWLSKIQKETELNQDWMRKITKAIRNKYKKVDTKLIDEEKLFLELDELYKKL